MWVEKHITPASRLPDSVFANLSKPLAPGAFTYRLMDIDWKMRTIYRAIQRDKTQQSIYTKQYAG